MSEQIKQAFYHALAARGAYADLTTDGDNLNLLQTASLSLMSVQMAKYFIAHFNVAYSNVSTNILTTGYQGLLLQEKDAQGNLTDHYILANRGTEVPEFPDAFTLTGFKDLIADLMLSVVG